MARVKTTHTIPSFVSAPVLSVASINELRAHVGAAATALPAPLRAPVAGHPERLSRLAILGELLQDPETAAAVEVAPDHADQLRAQATACVRLAAAAMGLARWAEDARDLSAGVQVQLHGQLNAAVAALVKDPERTLRERHVIEDLWTRVRRAQSAARSVRLEAERSHHAD